MRQAGIIAAAGVYALEHNVERLAQDHANAKRLAEGLADIAGISIAPEEVETNMVYFAVDSTRMSAPELAARLLAAHGVRVGPIDEVTLRAVTHLDVAASEIEAAIQAVRELLAN
jgi:threonine aldolase